MEHDIDCLPASRALDALVAEKIFGVEVQWLESPFELRVTRDGEFYHYVLPEYSTSIAAAWEVHHQACGWLFSKRRAYLDALTEMIRAEVKQPVAWPDAMIFLKPEHICRAALKTVQRRGVMRMRGKRGVVNLVFGVIVAVAFGVVLGTAYSIGAPEYPKKAAQAEIK